jgi:lantibiotic modifying enzyme
LQTAAGIADRLCRDAVWSADRCAWLGATLEWSDAEASRMVVYRSFGGEWYDGSSGIAAFLGRLWTVTGDDGLRDTAVGAVRHALSFAERPGGQALGLYDGMVGIALSAVRLGQQLGSAALVGRGLELGERVAASDTEQATLDLLGGSAGVVLGLAVLGAEQGRSDLVDAAVARADALIARAHRHPAGWSWPPESARGVQLDNPCSYAHGNAGIAHALDELCAITGEPRFGAAAFEALRWERTWFDRRHSSWSDLRNMTRRDLDRGHRPPSCEHWCHGAVGLGFHRLRRFALTGDAAMRAEAGAAVMGARSMALRAVQGSQPFRFEANFSLCHGLGGVLDLLIYCGETLGGAGLLRDAEHLAEVGRNAALSNNGRWSCGLDGGGETPGLMLGLAGIGMAYLRLAMPGRFSPAAIVINQATRPG